MNIAVIRDENIGLTSFALVENPEGLIRVHPGVLMVILDGKKHRMEDVCSVLVPLFKLFDALGREEALLHLIAEAGEKLKDKIEA